MAKEVTHLDLVMFPLDPGLGKDFMKGAEQFLANIKTDHLAPMHFHEQYEKIAKFEVYAKSHACNFIGITHSNETINF